MQEIYAFALGVAVCFGMVRIFRSATIAKLKADMNAKAEAWCAGCAYHKDIQQKNETITRLRLRNNDLEKRCDKLTRSKIALGEMVQRRSWGRV